MNLRPGHAIQLQLMRTDRARLYSLLIGYVADQAIIVTTPSKSLVTDEYAMLEGDHFVCRAFSGKRAFGFQTTVLRVAQLPFPHIYLSYPSAVEAVVIRKATRVPFRRDITIKKAGAVGEDTVSALLCDLSLTGAGLEGGVDLAKPSELLELVLVGSAAQQPPLELKSTVRTARAADEGSSSGRWHFGVEFVALTPEQASGLQELLQQRLLDEL